MKLLIMAGGGGTRLWPLSRNKKPKQLHRLVGDSSLLQMTLSRAKKVPGLKPKDIYIATNRKFMGEIRKQSRLPLRQIIGEPAKRDTAAAVGLAAVLIAEQTGDESEVIGMLSSDHIMRREELISAAVELAGKTAWEHPGFMVTIGVRPTRPETTLGYIEMHHEEIFLEKAGSLPVYKVASFKEKPDLKTAEEFVKSFRYLWNLGLYFFRIDTLFSLYQKFAPELYEGLMRIRKGLQKGQGQSIIDKIYPTLPAISIDYAVSEKNKDFLVIPVDQLGWTDVGYFTSLWDILEKDVKGNVVQAPNVLLHETKNSLVYGQKKLIACLGVQDLVIVDTGDVLLVAHKNATPGTKELIKKLEASKYKKLL